MTKTDGNRVHDLLAKSAQDEDEDGHALDEDNAHRLVPVAAAHTRSNGCDHCVNAKTRGAGERSIGRKTHDDGHDAGANAGRSDQSTGQRLAVSTQNGATEHCGVNRNDVGHGEERREASA